MDKFDQWYNKKMDEQEVAYSESSWDSFSQQLNQLPERRNRRRPFMLWILALTILVGSGSIFTWKTIKDSDAVQQIPATLNEEKSDAAPASDHKTDEAKSGNTTAQPLAAIAVPDSPETNSETKSSQPGISSGKVKNENIQKAPIRQPKENSVREQLNTSRNKAIALNDGAVSAKSNSTQTRDNGLISDKQRIVESAKTIESPFTDAVIISSNQLANTSVSLSGNESINALTTGENSQITSINSFENLVIEPLAFEIEGLEQKSLALPMVSFLNKPLDGVEPAIIECCPFKGWTHHVELGAQFFPGVNEGSRFFTGLQAAYHLQYRWAQRWSASAGAGVLQRWGSFGGFQDSPQDIYTNTRVRRGFLLVPTAATYLQIPTMVNFHAGKHIIGAGVRTLFLLGIQGQLDEYQLERSANEDFSFSSNTVNTGWINDSGFRSIVPEYLLSYSYQFNSQWSVSISGAWMPNGIVYAEKSNDNLDILSSLAFDTGSRQEPFLLEDRWQAGIALRYKF